MAYNLMKRIITNAKKDGTLAQKRGGIMDKLDVYLAADRLTAAQYKELTGMMEEAGANE